jgi:hypothetical protein
VRKEDYVSLRLSRLVRKKCLRVYFISEHGTGPDLPQCPEISHQVQPAETAAALSALAADPARSAEMSSRGYPREDEAAARRAMDDPSAKWHRLEPVIERAIETAALMLESDRPQASPDLRGPGWPRLGSPHRSSPNRERSEQPVSLASGPTQVLVASAGNLYCFIASISRPEHLSRSRLSMVGRV